MESCASISKSAEDATKYPGVAKFGIALEWGSRGLEFESRHSDQKSRNSIHCFCFFLLNERFELLNATRMSVAGDGSTELHIKFSFPYEKKNANESRHLFSTYRDIDV